MFKQLVTPNFNIPYVGGLCEGYVEGTVGQATLPSAKNPMTYGVYPTAAAAWNAHPDHPNELPPMGIQVAVHFKLGNNAADHVALWLGDGRVASSTQSGFHDTPFIHKNIDDLIATYAKYNGSCKYKGWSEWIGKLKVVEKENGMNKYDMAALYWTGLHRPAESESNLLGHENETPAKVIDSFREGAEWLTQNHILQVAYPEAQKRIEELERQIADMGSSDSDFIQVTTYVKKGDIK